MTQLHLFTLEFAAFMLVTATLMVASLYAIEAYSVSPAWSFVIGIGVATALDWVSKPLIRRARA